MTQLPELFISIDVEADGPVPGLSSMLSLGAAAITLDKRVLGVFSANLCELPQATPHPDTEDFWRDNPEAYAQARLQPNEPALAMMRFATWLTDIGAGYGNPVALCYPAAYDFKWVDYYTQRFNGHNPFGYNGALDGKSFAAGMLGLSLAEISRGAFPPAWFDPGLPHTHVAVDDALEQGGLLVNMVRHSRRLPPLSGLHMTAAPNNVVLSGSLSSSFYVAST